MINVLKNNIGTLICLILMHRCCLYNYRYECYRNGQRRNAPQTRSALDILIVHIFTYFYIFNEFHNTNTIFKQKLLDSSETIITTLPPPVRTYIHTCAVRAPNEFIFLKVIFVGLLDVSFGGL